MAETYKSLNYEHNEINNLLRKIETNHVLTADQYKQLIENIGLNKIEKILKDFDGSYDSLKDLPNINEIAARVAMGYFDALRSEMLTTVEAGDDEVREDIEVKLEAFHDLLFDLEDGVLTKDEQFKDEMMKEFEELIALISEIDKRIVQLKAEKANELHYHESKHIVDLSDTLDSFEIKLKEENHLDDLNSKSHTHPKEVMELNAARFKKWDEKASLKHIYDLRDSITEIKDDYVTTSDIKDCINDLKSDLELYMLKEDCFDLLDEKSHVKHMHEIKDINKLAERLDSKVNKEINKVLIDIKLLARIKNLIALRDLWIEDLQNQGGEYYDHGHGNLDVLETISDDEINKWNQSVNEARVKELINNEFEDINLDELINNEFYTKEEIDDMILNTGSTDIESRLNGLTFIPITTEEFNALSEEDKEDSTVVYIITDATAYESNTDEFITNGKLDSKLRELLNSGSVLTDEVLDKRLDGMSLKKTTAANYNKDEKEENVLYVITDADEIDMTLYLTKEDFRERISDPATTSNRPENPNIGQCCFDTTLNQPIWYTGSIWVDALGNPV